MGPPVEFGAMEGEAMFGLTIAELAAASAVVVVGVLALALVTGYCLGALRERRRNQTFIAQELAACGSVLPLNSRINVLDQALDDAIDRNRVTSVRVTEIEKTLGIAPSKRATDQQATETAGRADDTMYPPNLDKA
jgi:hypothetical protein